MWCFYLGEWRPYCWQPTSHRGWALISVLTNHSGVKVTVVSQKNIAPSHVDMRCIVKISHANIVELCTTDAKTTGHSNTKAIPFECSKQSLKTVQQKACKPAGHFGFFCTFCWFYQQHCVTTCHLRELQDLIVHFNWCIISPAWMYLKSNEIFQINMYQVFSLKILGLANDELLIQS